MESSELQMKEMNQKTHLSNYISDMEMSSSPSDLELIRQIAVKDKNALEELYQRYHLSVFNFLLRTTQETSSGEDLLQDVFLSVWEGAARFEGRSSVKTWLFRIAHFKAAEWLRNKKIHVEDYLDEANEALPEQEAPSVESLVFLQWNFSHIQQAMKQLSHHHGEVIELTFTYGLKATEIAQILDCPVGTVKSRLHIALRQLNAILISKGIIS